MEAECPDFTLLLAAAEDRLGPEREAVWRQHLARCPKCTAALAELRQVHAALAALAAAEVAAAPANSYARIQARLARPGLAARLPLGVAGACRQAGELLHPAVAGSAAAALAGLALGTWMALATPRGTSDAAATEPYAVSTLVDDSASGLAGSYLAASDATSNGTPSHAAGNDSASDATVPRDSAADSQRGQP